MGIAHLKIFISPEEASQQCLNSSRDTIANRESAVLHMTANRITRQSVANNFLECSALVDFLSTPLEGELVSNTKLFSYYAYRA
jgi:hypothetical protein